MQLVDGTSKEEVRTDFEGYIAGTSSIEVSRESTILSVFPLKGGVL